MNIWDWAVILLFIVAAVIGVKVLLLERSFKQTKNTPKYYQKWIVGHIDRAKEDLKVVSECLNPYVFNDVADDIRKKLSVNSRFKVKIITGPIIYRNSGTNRLYELVKEGNFGDRLQYGVASSAMEQDFILVDSRHAYLCDPHGTDPRPTGFATMIEGNPSYAQQFSHSFDRMWLTVEPSPRITFKDYGHKTERKSRASIL